MKPRHHYEIFVTLKIADYRDEMQVFVADSSFAKNGPATTSEVYSG
jgi:hypothetical protein